MKVLAAHRFGIKRVILPERNMKDLAEVPPAVLTNLEVKIYLLYFLLYFDKEIVLGDLSFTFFFVPTLFLLLPNLHETDNCC